jgi:two-component system, OmpR family, phosphate regulon response regulator PhoB
LIRSKKKATPVVFLTGESHVTQKVRGFELDAEDYITKPIEPREFSARIASRLRKIDNPTAANTQFLTRAEFHIDLSTHTASIQGSAGQLRELGLTPTEYKLLVHFLRHEDELITRDELRKAAWGDKVHVTSHTVDTHLSALRKKLGPEARYLQAVIRKGYRFSIGEQVAKSAVGSGRG